jgi:hypothetical protein
MRLRALPKFFAVLGCLLAVGLAVAGHAGEEPAPPATFSAAELSLREEIEDRFDILLLRSGLALEPHDDIDGVGTIELAAGTVALDGTTVNEATLRSRIGKDADLVLELSRLGDTRGRALFSRGAVGGDAASTGGGSGLPLENPGDWEPALPTPPTPPDLPGSPAMPTPPRPPHGPKVSSDARVSVGSRVTVGADEVADDVVAVGGSVVVDGTVHGSAIAIGGGVTVDGKVTEDVVSVGGRVSLGPNAEVLGNVTSVGGRVVRDPAAKIYGQVSEVSLGSGLSLGLPGLIAKASEGDEHPLAEPLADTFDFLWAAFSTLVLLMLCVLCQILAGPTVERIANQLRRDVFKSALTGLVAAILFLPLLFLVVLVLAVSVIGIPLLVLVPFAILALALAALLGYAAAAQCLGEWLRDRFGWQARMTRAYSALAIGVLAIQSVSLLAKLLDIPGGPLELFSLLFGVAGFLFKLGVWMTGFGAAVLVRPGFTRRRAAVQAYEAPAWVPPPSDVSVPPVPVLEPAAPSSEPSTTTDTLPGTAPEGTSDKN